MDSVDAARSADGNRRRWGTLTLGILYSWGVLAVRTTEQFASALWDRLDDTGLPIDTDYFPHGFLTLPHPPDIEPVNVFKRWVRGQRFPLQKNGTSVRIDAPIPLCDAIIGSSVTIEWSREEAGSILDSLIEWWDTDKGHLSRSGEITSSSSATKTDSSILGEFRRRFSRLADTLAALALSLDFKPIENDTEIESLERVVDEMTEHGLPTLRLKTAYLHMFPESRDSVLRRIERSTASSHEEVVVDATQSCGDIL